MAADTFVVFAASYDTLGEAEADYHAVRELYQASGLIDTYDAAGITRDDADRVEQASTHASGLTSRQLMADEAALERDIDAAVPSTGRSQDDPYRQAVAHAEAAVAEAEAAAAAAEREAQRYSAFRSPPDSGAGGFTG
jgi:hypothetical protein